MQRPGCPYPWPAPSPPPDQSRRLTSFPAPLRTTSTCQRCSASISGGDGATHGVLDTAGKWSGAVLHRRTGFGLIAPDLRCARRSGFSAAPQSARRDSSRPVPRVARRTPCSAVALGERSRDFHRYYRRSGPSPTFRRARTPRTRPRRRLLVRPRAANPPRHPLFRVNPGFASRSILLVGRQRRSVNRLATPSMFTSVAAAGIVTLSR